MKHNPDDRSDNVKKIQRNIDMTRKNMELASDMMAESDNLTTKKQIADKNERRAQALKGMKSEIKDEADYQKSNYKKDSTAE